MASHFIGKRTVALAQGWAVGRQRARSSVISSTSSWLERDLLPPDAAHRTGTPQSRHMHGDHGGSRD